MANTLLTPSVIARESLLRLSNNLVAANLVHRDYSDEYVNVGDTVTIRKPASFTAQAFSTAISVQNITESSVAVTLDQHYDVSVEITAKQLTLSLEDFGRQVLDGMVAALAQKIDSSVLAAYVDTPYTVGTAGTTPAAVADLTNVGEVLSNAQVPVAGRRLVINPAAENKLLQLGTFHEADKRGDTAGLIEANLGRKFGLDIYMDQNAAQHSNGTIAHTGTFAIDGAALEDATTVTVDGTTVTGTWAKGSLFTVADVAGQYALTADATAATNEVAISFFPAAPAGGFPDGKEVTRIADHAANLAFHETGIALVSRPLAKPLGVASEQAAVVNWNGIGLRVVQAYNATSKTDTVSLDALWGVKTLDPERVVRLLG